MYSLSVLFVTTITIYVGAQISFICFLIATCVIDTLTVYILIICKWIYARLQEASTKEMWRVTPDLLRYVLWLGTHPLPPIFLTVSVVAQSHQTMRQMKAIDQQINNRDTCRQNQWNMNSICLKACFTWNLKCASCWKTFKTRINAVLH